ncbi:MAG: GNAT family N-acetyltransferase [Rhodanobacteraceae bacterium]
MMLRPAKPTDSQAVLALNRAFVHFLSPLTRERLVMLERQARLHIVVEEHDAVVAFLLAFREGADYDSVNYRWFAERYDRFLYVDRAVVSGSHQGTGVGQAFYRHVFEHARQTRVPVVVCEYDVEPPNPASERFHARLGFHEVGRQTITSPAGRKTVSMQLASVSGWHDREA